jgi:hypothetical protein
MSRRNVLIAYFSAALLAALTGYVAVTASGILRSVSGSLFFILLGMAFLSKTGLKLPKGLSRAKYLIAVTVSLGMITAGFLLTESYLVSQIVGSTGWLLLLILWVIILKGAAEQAPKPSRWEKRVLYGHSPLAATIAIIIGLTLTLFALFMAISS